MYEFEIAVVARYFDKIPTALWVTIYLTAIAIAVSTVLGLLGALGRTSRSRLLRLAITAFTEFFRNVPLVVIIYLVFFGLPQVGLRFNNTLSVLIALVVNGTAFMIEVFRGGLLSIPSGQYQAAQAQGMRYHQMQILVILPQLIRNVYASYGNICVGILLGSSLASVISVNDLSHWMFQTGSDTFRYMEAFFVCAAIYFGLAQALNLLRELVRRLLFRTPG